MHAFAVNAASRYNDARRIFVKEIIVVLSDYVTIKIRISNPLQKRLERNWLMAQALPRFCPRCGTHTKANMRRCAACGLPVEAMLSRSANRQGGGDDLPAQKPAQPPPRHGQVQRDKQQDHSPIPDFPPPWALAQPQPHFSQLSPPSHNSQKAWENPEDTVAGEIWSTQSEPDALSTPEVTQGLPDDQNNPAGATDLEELPTRREPSLQSAPEAMQGLQNNQNNPVGTAGRWSGENRARFSSKPEVTQHERNTFDNPPAWAERAPVPPPIYNAPPQPNQRRRIGFMLVLLIILLVLGGVIYLVYLLAGGRFASQSQIKTTNLNAATNYAGIDITIINAQQAQNFVDDPQTASDGMLRLNLREQNKTTAPINWSYQRSARLLMPGKSAIAPVYVTSKGRIESGTTQNSILDFPIANGGNLNKLIFQLGTANEAQIQIPLAGQANLDRYQPKTSQQNGTLIYFGLNWTLTRVTTSLSIPGQQATSGMEFLTLTLKVDSTLSQQAITGSPFDYLRVQTGGKTVKPVDTTLPVSFAAGETGQTGTATFLIPQNSSACTLILLSQDPGTSGQASTDFQI
jgi:hypothetical protein